MRFNKISNNNYFMNNGYDHELIKNPFEFTYNKKFISESYFFHKLFVNKNKLEINKSYLKITYDITIVNNYSDSESEYESDYEVENVILYFLIPEKLKDKNSENINFDYLDDDSNLIKNDDTEEFFISWISYSQKYTPTLIEYIKICE